MDFSEPSEAVQIKQAIDDFIDQEVAPLETEYDEFLGADYEKHIVDDDHRQVPEYRALVEEIRQKSVEAGFYGMTMPEEVAAVTSTSSLAPSSANTWPTGHRLSQRHLRRCRRADADPAGL